MQGSDCQINSLRSIHFVFGVLNNQQYDPFCGNCVSFAKTTASAREKFLGLEKSIKRSDLSQDLSKLLSGIYSILSELKVPDNPVGQKKAGTCKFPEGVCIAKTAMTIYENIVG